MTPKQAEEVLKTHTHSLNSGWQIPGTGDDDVGTALEVLRQAGVHIRREFKDGKQKLWIDDREIV